MKTTRLIAAIALAFAATTATAAKLNVKVIDKRCDGIAYWVKYTINGVEYRSDQAPIRVNQHAWENMSDEDRQTTVETIYGVWNAREEQFGSKAGEMGYWYDKKKGWVEGAEILTDSLLERDYHDLYENFTNDKLWGEIKPDLTGMHIEMRGIHELSDEASLCWDWAKEAYKTLGQAVYLRAAAGVKSISGGLIELICDKVLVPNITPAGAGGLAAQIIGTALDYVNNVAGIQSGIINNVVGKRPTTEQTLEAIKRCDMVIIESRKFIATCIQRIAELKKEIKTKNAEYEKEKSAALAALTGAHAGWVGEALGDLNASTPEIVARIESLKEAIRNAKNDYDAYKKAEAAYEDYMTSKTNEVMKRYDEWRVACVGESFVNGTTLSEDCFVTQYKKRFDEIAHPYVSSGTLNDVTMSLDDANAAIEEKEKYLKDLKECHAGRRLVADAANAELNPYLVEGGNICRDANALGMSLGWRIEISQEERDGLNGGAFSSTPDGHLYYYRDIQNVFDIICRVADMNSYDSMELWEESRRIEEDITIFKSKHEKYRDQLFQTKAMQAAAANETAVAKQAFFDACAELETFVEELPTFVTEQRAEGVVTGMYPGLHPSDFEDDDVAICLDKDTELGRVFLDPSNPASVETAIAYRDKLNTLMDKYNSLLAKVNSAQMVYKAQFSTHRGCGVSFVVPDHYHGLLDASGSKGSAWSPSRYFSEDFSRGGLREFTALARDFNNRNNYHATEMDIFGDLTANEAEYSAGDGTRYQLVASTARGYAKRIDEEDLEDNLMWNLNPPPLYGYWNADMSYNPDATNYYNRAVGSYAYYAPGYFETVFASEPDPFDDFVAPLLNQIDVARAAAFGITLHIVTFDANGGSVDTAYRTVEKNAAVGKLPTPARNGWTFGGWWTAASGGTKVSESTIVSANVTYYAHWTQGGGEGGGSGGGSGGGTVVPTPTDAPTLFAAGKAETAFMGDATYNGWVRKADGSLAGLLTVKAAKPAKPEKGGQSKLTITYTPFGGKKQTIKLANDAMPVAGGVAMVAIPGVGTVKFTGDALVGVGVDVQAGKDMLKSKDRGEKAAATAAAASKAGVWTFALGTDAGYAAFSVTVDKKGKGKLAGTFPDGTKVSVSAQGVLGDGVLAIPFTYAKKGTLGFVFWVKGDGTAVLSDLTGDVGGSPGTARPTMVAPSASHRLADGEHVFTAGDVSQAFTVAGKKWNVPKQNKRAEVDPNPTGLKLAFTEKTGVVKGTFTVVNGKAKTKYTVVGAVVGGKFYGSAYVRKAVPIPATAE